MTLSPTLEYRLQQRAAMWYRLKRNPRMIVAWLNQNAERGMPFEHLYPRIETAVRRFQRADRELKRTPEYAAIVRLTRTRRFKHLYGED